MVDVLKEAILRETGLQEPEDDVQAIAEMLHKEAVTVSLLHDGLIKDEDFASLGFNTRVVLALHSMNKAPIAAGDWFVALTGMHEPRYRMEKKRIFVDTKFQVEEGQPPYLQIENQLTGQKFDAGQFGVLSLYELLQQAQKACAGREAQNSEMATFEIVCRDYMGNVRNVDVSHLQTLPENENAMFQVASNFNGVESVGENIPPDEPAFTEEYIYDRTQGPAASVSAGPAAITRVHAAFFHPDKDQDSWLQSRKHQVNFLDPLPTIFPVQNGYVCFPEKDKHPLPEFDSEAWRDLLMKCKIGMHRYCQVTTGHRAGSKFEIPRDLVHVNQTFCAAVNIGQGLSGSINRQSSYCESKCRFALQLAYQGAYLAAQACGSSKLFLTLIGGGVFGNDRKWIFEAMFDAHQRYATMPGGSLREVKVVQYSPSDAYPASVDLARQYQIPFRVATFTDTGVRYSSQINWPLLQNDQDNNSNNNDLVSQSDNFSTAVTFDNASSVGPDLMDAYGYDQNMNLMEAVQRIRWSDSIWRYARTGSVADVKFKLAQDGELAEARDDKGRTPLHYAADNNRVEVLEYLLTDVRVDPSPEDLFNMTPLNFAQICQHQQAIEILLRHGASENHNAVMESQAALSASIPFKDLNDASYSAPDSLHTDPDNSTYYWKSQPVSSQGNDGSLVQTRDQYMAQLKQETSPLTLENVTWQFDEGEGGGCSPEFTAAAYKLLVSALEPEQEMYLLPQLAFPPSQAPFQLLVSKNSRAHRFQRRTWSAGVMTLDKRPVAFASALEFSLRIGSQIIRNCMEAHSLVVDRQFQSKGYAGAVMKALQQRCAEQSNGECITAVHTSAYPLPHKPVTVLTQLHRPLRVGALVDCMFHRLDDYTPLAEEIVRYSVLIGDALLQHRAVWRRAHVDDLPSILSLLNKKLTKYPIAEHFETVEQLQMRLMPVLEDDSDPFVQCYVFENENGVVTDMFSFYTLLGAGLIKRSSVPLKIAYGYYWVANSMSDSDVIRAALVFAEADNCHMFSLLNCMDNTSVADQIGGFSVDTDNNVFYHFMNINHSFVDPSKMALLFW